MAAENLNFCILLTISCGFRNVILQSNIDDVEILDLSTLTPIIEQPSSRIVGGRNADDGQFPYQVSLRMRNSHMCGGAIISPTFIVTAAHCLTTSSRGRSQTVPIQSLSIRAGSTSLSTGGVTIPVAQIILHPNYNNTLNDIALLRLNAALSFNERIKPIALATGNIPTGSAVIVSGWGRLNANGPRPNRLQYTTLNAISNAECRRVYRRVPDSLLCLSHRSGLGVCQGDSGGPGAFNNQLVGIVNFVVGGCGSSFPDGFANVTHHAAWIRQNSRV